MTSSPSLGFNLILANQSSKHVTANAALLALEAIAAGVALGILNSEPPSPVDGSLYIVSATPTGAFTGQANKFAYYYGATWFFYSPKNNQRLYNAATSSYVAYNGTTWTAISLGGSPSPTTTEGDLIVRGTSVDNRLPVGTNTQVLTVDTSVPGKLKWAPVPAPATPSPTTTKGDLIVRDATSDVRLPVGNAGEVLLVDPATATGLKWQSPTALPTPAGYQIQEFSVANVTPSPSSLPVNPNLTNPIIFGTGNAPLPITYNLGTSPSITVTSAGLYRVSGHVTINASATTSPAISQIGLSIISGTATKSNDIFTPTQNVIAARQVVNWSLLLNVTVAPTVFAVGYGTTSGSNTSVNYIGDVASTSTSRMRIEKIS
jgi:hypothetical protein